MSETLLLLWGKTIPSALVVIGVSCVAVDVVFSCPANLHSNHLIGPVPRNLFALTNLKGLWLGGNHLSGEIHADIANLTKLLDLTLEPNDFEKPYPPLPVRI